MLGGNEHVKSFAKRLIFVFSLRGELAHRLRSDIFSNTLLSVVTRKMYRKYRSGRTSTFRDQAFLREDHLV